jgi:hypothetical protein
MIIQRVCPPIPYRTRARARARTRSPQNQTAERSSRTGTGTGTRTASARSSNIGSAYIEALAVATMFALVLACAIRFGRSYHARILADQRARAAAWTQVACELRDGEILSAATSLPGTRSSDALQAALSRSAISSGLSEPAALGALPLGCNALPERPFAGDDAARRFIHEVLGGGSALP